MLIDGVGSSDAHILLMEKILYHLGGKRRFTTRILFF